jgi:hypothetical protein
MDSAWQNLDGNGRKALIRQNPPLPRFGPKSAEKPPKRPKGPFLAPEMMKPRSHIAENQENGVPEPKIYGIRAEAPVLDLFRGFSTVSYHLGVIFDEK